MTKCTYILFEVSCNACLETLGHENLELFRKYYINNFQLKHVSLRHTKFSR
jgi:hypothetical protein